MKKKSFLIATCIAISIINYSCSDEKDEIMDNEKQGQMANNNLSFKGAICNINQQIGPSGNYNCFGFAFLASETGKYEKLEAFDMNRIYFESGLYKKGGEYPSKVLYWHNSADQGKPDRADHAAIITDDNSSPLTVRSKEGNGGVLRENCLTYYYLPVDEVYSQVYSLDIELTSNPANPQRGQEFTLSTKADGRNLGIEYLNWDYDHTAIESVKNDEYKHKFRIKNNAPSLAYTFTLTAIHQAVPTGEGSYNESHAKKITSIKRIFLPALPAFTVSVSGPKCIPINTTSTWTAVPKNGSAPYTYSWNIFVFTNPKVTNVKSSNSSFSYYCKPGYRVSGSVTVTGSDGRTATTNISVSGDCLPYD
jgi:hypothetical protein